MLNVYFRYVWTHYKSFLTWFILIFALNNQLEWSYNRCFPATNEASKRYKRYENGWNAKISAKRYTFYICDLRCIEEEDEKLVLLRWTKSWY